MFRPPNAVRGATRARFLLLVMILIVLGCVGSATAAARTPGTRPAATSTWRSGVFAGFGASADLQFGTWRGSAIQSATDFIGTGSWSQIEYPTWTISQWAAVPSVQPDLSVAMFPSGGSLAAAASGAYDWYFRVLATNLVRGGLATASIRLGWEFNGSWYPWSVSTPADAANYAAGWRQIVSVMRSVHGQQFAFDWAPTDNEGGGIDPGLAYPGDRYVTDIGLDVYDWNPSADATATDRWNALVNNGYGLAWQASFAASHGKPIAFPEWGLVYYAPYPPAGGGDDPTFIQNMFDWFGSHNTLFENYFDTDDTTDGFDYGLTTGNGQFPQATAVYQQLFGG